MFSADPFIDSLMVAGVLLSVVSQVWLVVIIAKDGPQWVLLYFVLFPLIALYYLAWHRMRCRWPFACLMLAAGVEFVALLYWRI